MAKKILLYDIRQRKYPHKRGDIFRSLQVFECWVCGALTNKIIMGGHPGYGIRAICPNSSECWHHEIEAKIKLISQPHPKSYKEELQLEINKLKAASASNIKIDISGNPNFNLKLSVTNVFSYKKDSNCKHSFIG